MIIILKDSVKEKEVNSLVENLKSKGLSIHYSKGESSTIVGLIGDTTKIDIDSLNAYSFVAGVKRVSEPFKLVNRKFHENDTVVQCGESKIGGEYFGIIAGPCSVESEEQVLNVAKRVKLAGAQFLRGGAFKPRTSPYAFKGLKAEGIELLLLAKKQVGLPIVSELTSIENIHLFNDVDIIQVGARNMQNFDMLTELGRSKKTILLKRGLSSTIEELLMSAEYILSGGNSQVILCERGIRTFEPMTRNTLDISCVPLLKRLTHLPVIVDPSHASGHSYLVKPLAKAAVSSGADGVMIEVHPNPACALCDGAQSVDCDSFDDIAKDIKNLARMENKII